MSTRDVDVPNRDPILTPEQVPGFTLHCSRAHRRIHVGRPPAGPWEWEDSSVREEWRKDSAGFWIKLDLRLCASPEAAIAALEDCFLWSWSVRPPLAPLPIGDCCWSVPGASHLFVATEDHAFKLSRYPLDDTCLETIAKAIVRRLETWKPLPPPPLYLEVRVQERVACWRVRQMVKVEITSSVDPVTFRTEIFGPQGKVKLLCHSPELGADEEDEHNPFLFFWEGWLDPGRCGGRVPTAKPGPYDLVITATDGYGRSVKETVAIEVSD